MHREVNDDDRDMVTYIVQYYSACHVWDRKYVIVCVSC